MIVLRAPVRSERARDGDGRWRTVFVYRCPDCNKEVRVFASAFRGRDPVPSTGGIDCPHCAPVARQGGE